MNWYEKLGFVRCNRCLRLARKKKCSVGGRAKSNGEGNESFKTYYFCNECSHELVSRMLNGNDLQLEKFFEGEDLDEKD